MNSPGARTALARSPSGRGGSGGHKNLELLATGHRLVPTRHAVEVDGGVEDLAGLDGAVEDVGHQLVDVGPYWRHAASVGEVAVKHAEVGGIGVLRGTDATDRAAVADHAKAVSRAGRRPTHSRTVCVPSPA